MSWGHCHPLHVPQSRGHLCPHSHQPVPFQQAHVSGDTGTPLSPHTPGDLPHRHHPVPSCWGHCHPSTTLVPPQPPTPPIVSPPSPACPRHSPPAAGPSAPGAGSGTWPPPTCSSPAAPGASPPPPVSAARARAPSVGCHPRPTTHPPRPRHPQGAPTQPPRGRGDATHRLLAAAPGPGAAGPCRRWWRWRRPRGEGAHARRGVAGSRQVVGVHGGLVRHGCSRGLRLGDRGDEGGLHQPLQVLAGGDGRHRGHEGAGHVTQAAALLRAGRNGGVRPCAAAPPRWGDAGTATLLPGSTAPAGESPRRCHTTPSCPGAHV